MHKVCGINFSSIPIYLLSFLYSKKDVLMLSLKEAAEAVGKSKQTMMKAVKNGRISAKKDDKGVYRIDPSELFRVYTPIAPTDTQKKGASMQQPKNDQSVSHQQLIEVMQQQIDELKNRLMESEKERRATQDKMTALLTDQRNTKKRGLIARILDI